MSYTDSKGRAWHDLDVASLPQAAQEAYARYQAQNKLAAQAREGFEALAKGAMGTELVQFGYKWGKLSFTIDGVAKPKGPAKATVTLEQFLAQQARAGAAH